MSSSFKQKHRSLGSDVRRPPLAAQKADILASSSSHPGPHSLTLPPKETAQRKEGSLNERQAQTLGHVRGKKDTSSAAFVESEVSRSKQDQVRDYSSHAGTKEDTAPSEAAISSSNSLSQTLKEDSQKESKCLSVQANLQLFFSDSSHESLGAEGQTEGVTGQRESGEGVKVQVHERKLQKELKKLSAPSWPSRDRLAVFSDVFDDVCESSPVFGRILREIKTEYDRYINHLMGSHFSPDDTSQQALVKDIVEMTISDKEVENPEKEVCRLQEEARRALEENERVKDELKNLQHVMKNEYNNKEYTSLSRNEDSGIDIDNVVQLRRLQVLSVLEEIQELEEEIHKAAGPETHAETLKMIASNHHLRTINKDLQEKINSVLEREKPGRDIKQMLWREIDRDFQTEELWS